MISKLQVQMRKCLDYNFNKHNIDEAINCLTNHDCNLVLLLDYYKDDDGAVYSTAQTVINFTM